MISVVSPVYKAREIVPELVSRLKNVLVSLSVDFEIILVDDGCPQQSWISISDECKKDDRVVGLKLSRNFGQHNAITAGLAHAKGEWIVVMDCDLQDQPEEIFRLIDKSKEGYKVVFAIRNTRQDIFLKRLSSKLFYRFFSYMTETKQDARIANFGIYHRSVVEAILSMKDHIRYFPAMVQWVGFDRCGIEVKHASRFSGRTSYNWKGLFKLATLNVLAFSAKPMYITIKIGLLIVLVAVFISVYYFFKWLIGDIVVLGFSSLIISIWLLFGIMISFIGIVGLYVGGVFDKVKDRPLFIVDKFENR